MSSSGDESGVEPHSPTMLESPRQGTVGEEREGEGWEGASLEGGGSPKPAGEDEEGMVSVATELFKEGEEVVEGRNESRRSSKTEEKLVEPSKSTPSLLDIAEGELGEEGADTEKESDRIMSDIVRKLKQEESDEEGVLTRLSLQETNGAGTSSSDDEGQAKTSEVKSGEQGGSTSTSANPGSAKSIRRTIRIQEPSDLGEDKPKSYRREDRRLSAWAVKLEHGDDDVRMNVRHPNEGKEHVSSEFTSIGDGSEASPAVKEKTLQSEFFSPITLLGDVSASAIVEELVEKIKDYHTQLNDLRTKQKDAQKNENFPLLRQTTAEINALQRKLDTSKSDILEARLQQKLKDADAAYAREKKILEERWGTREGEMADRMKAELKAIQIRYDKELKRLEETKKANLSDYKPSAQLNDMDRKVKALLWVNNIDEAEVLREKARHLEAEEKAKWRKNGVRVFREQQSKVLARKQAEERKLAARHDNIREHFEETRISAFRDLDSKYRRIRDNIPRVFAKKQKQIALEIQAAKRYRYNKDAVSSTSSSPTSSLPSSVVGRPASASTPAQANGTPNGNRLAGVNELAWTPTSTSSRAGTSLHATPESAKKGGKVSTPASVDTGKGQGKRRPLSARTTPTSARSLLASSKKKEEIEKEKEKERKNNKPGWNSNVRMKEPIGNISQLSAEKKKHGKAGEGSEDGNEEDKKGDIRKPRVDTRTPKSFLEREKERKKEREREREKDRAMGEGGRSRRFTLSAFNFRRMGSKKVGIVEAEVDNEMRTEMERASSHSHHHHDEDEWQGSSGASSPLSPSKGGGTGKGLPLNSPSRSKGKTLRMLGIGAGGGGVDDEFEDVDEERRGSIGSGGKLGRRNAGGSKSAKVGSGSGGKFSMVEDMHRKHESNMRVIMKIAETLTGQSDGGGGIRLSSSSSAAQHNVV